MTGHPDFSTLIREYTPIWSKRSQICHFQIGIFGVVKGQTLFFTFDPYGSNKPSPKCQFENGKFKLRSLVNYRAVKNISFQRCDKLWIPLLHRACSVISMMIGGEVRANENFPNKIITLLSNEMRRNYVIMSYRVLHVCYKAGTVNLSPAIIAAEIPPATGNVTSQASTMLRNILQSTFSRARNRPTNTTLPTYRQTAIQFVKFKMFLKRSSPKVKKKVKMTLNKTALHNIDVFTSCHLEALLL